MKTKLHLQTCKINGSFYSCNKLLLLVQAANDNNRLYADIDMMDKKYCTYFLRFDPIDRKLINLFNVSINYYNYLQAKYDYIHLTWKWNEINEDEDSPVNM